MTQEADKWDQLTRAQTDKLQALLVWLALVSLITVLPLLVTYIVFKQKRESFGGLLSAAFVASIAMLELFRVIPLFTGFDRMFESKGWCQTQAVGTQLFALLSVFLWMLITINLYQLLPSQQNRPSKVLNFFASRTALVGFVCLAIVLTIVPGVGGAFGSQRPFLCWFGDDEAGKNTKYIFSIACYYVWMICIVIAGGFLWVRIVLQLRRAARLAAQYSSLLARQGSGVGPERATGPSGNMQQRLTYNRQVALVLFVLIVCLVTFVNNVASQIMRSEPFGFWLVDIICVSALGVGIFLVIGPTKVNIDLWRACCVGCCCRRRTSRSMLDSDQPGP